MPLFWRERIQSIIIFFSGNFMCKCKQVFLKLPNTFNRLFDYIDNSFDHVQLIFVKGQNEVGLFDQEGNSVAHKLSSESNATKTSMTKSTFLRTRFKLLVEVEEKEEEKELKVSTYAIIFTNCDMIIRPLFFPVRVNGRSWSCDVKTYLKYIKIYEIKYKTQPKGNFCFSKNSFNDHFNSWF